MKRTALTLGALATASALALSACTPNNGQSSGTSGSNENANLKFVLNEPFYSANSNSNTGNNIVNSSILNFTQDSFKYYDKDLKLQDNDSFGTVEKVSDSPLKVKYTIADTAKWSDGTPYSAADLVLAWGAQSGNFNTKSADKVADDEGNVKKQKGSNVVFNAADPGLALIKKFPEVSKDNKTVTVTYAKPFADWQLNLTTRDGGLPAHLVAKKALGIDDATKANAAILKAFKSDDKKTLTKVANVWNTGFDMTKMPTDKDLLVGTGPYTITAFKENQYLTLTRRDDYAGSRKPNIKTVTARFIKDPSAAVQALQNGEVDLINPNATADTVKQLDKVDNATTVTGTEGTYGHIDLAPHNGGPFDPKTYGGDASKALKVRQAFLMTIPRDKFVSDIIKPINPDARVRNSFTTVPGSPSYDSIVKANGMENSIGTFDVNKAKALLKEAGATSPKVRVLFANENPRGEQQFQLIKESAEKAGFKLIDGSSAKWSQELSDPTAYDASMFAWISTSTAVTESDANFRTGGTNNLAGYTNKSVDKLYDQLQTELNANKQMQIEGKIEKHLVDDAFGLPTFQYPSVVAYNKKLQGVDPITVAPTMLWNFYDWKMS